MSKCPLCGSGSSTVAYSGKIRMGDIAHLSESEHIVWKCQDCSVQWLADNNRSAEYYFSDEYRKEIGQKCDLQDYRSRHDGEVDYQLDIVPLGTYRDKVVADIGCGGGSFLDAIRGFARQTIAVEINEAFLRQLQALGHRGYPTIDKLVEAGERPEVIVAQSVIEHVENPRSLVRRIREALQDQGTAIITTPNAGEFLLSHGPNEYKSFFYRKAHAWYFDGDALAKLMQHAGFRDIRIKYLHSYGLSNSLLWMRDRQGPGRRDIIADNACDFAWKNYLERTGQAERVICIAS